MQPPHQTLPVLQERLQIVHPRTERPIQLTLALLLPLFKRHPPLAKVLKVDNSIAVRVEILEALRGLLKGDLTAQRAAKLAASSARKDISGNGGRSYLPELNIVNLAVSTAIESIKQFP